MGLKGLFAGAICMLLACASIAPYAYASDGEAVDAELAFEKDETVRVTADASGSPHDVEVLTTLRNGNGSVYILDKSDLEDIEPGDNSRGFESEGSNLIWQADGEDVSYSGKTDKDLPVKIHVTYTLDGREMAPDEIAGASGHVAVRYDYDNEAVIDGTATPFAMMTALLLDDERFSRVEVTNGKLISDKGRTIIVGYALPGMQSALEPDAEGIDLPAYFSFEADVKGFELNGSLTLASSNLFNDFSSEDLDASKLSSSARQLQASLLEIIDATNGFSKGIKELSSGMRTLSDSLDVLSKGIPALTSAIAQAVRGTSDLSEGLESAADGIAQLEAGANGVVGGLGTVIYGDGSGNAGLKGAVDGTTKLAEAAKELSSGLKAVSTDKDFVAFQNTIRIIAEILNECNFDETIAALQNAQTEIQNDIAQANAMHDKVQSAAGAIGEARSALAGVDTSSIEDPDVKASVDAALAKADASIQFAEEKIYAISDFINAVTTEAMQKTIDVLQTASEKVGSAYTSIKALVDKINAGLSDFTDKAVPGSEELANGIAQLAEGLDAAVIGLEAIYGGSQTVLSGIRQLGDESDGIPAAASGARRIEGGLSEIGQSTEDLEEGVDAIAQGASNLADGASQAASGSDSLVDGLQTYKREGVDAIAKLFTENLQGLIDRFFSSVELGRDFDNFSGKADGTPSSVRFIYEIAGITDET